MGLKVKSLKSYKGLKKFTLSIFTSHKVANNPNYSIGSQSDPSTLAERK